MSLEETSSSTHDLPSVVESDPSTSEFSNNLLPDTRDTSNDDAFYTPTIHEGRSNSEPNNPTMVVVTSPSFTSDLSAEQHDSIDPLTVSSASPYLQTKQRRIDHRRNRSEPVKSASSEDLSSLTNIDSSLSNNAKQSIRRKSSTKIKSTHEEKPSFSSTTTRKKKVWYNPFQSTYRQRNDEFRKLFKDLPNDERLIVDYSCAWQKDILIQGRMYLSQNYLCFYANILNWKSSLCLRFKDIVGLTREKTAKVISNAIEVRSNKNEKYFFASFVTRDKTYALMYRIWQSSLVDQPIATRQLWEMIHESYGGDLDMTTDEEDNYHELALNLKPVKLPVPAMEKYDRLSPNSIPAKFSPTRDDRSSVSSQGEYLTEEEDMIIIGEGPPTNEDMNSTSENPEITYLSECLCQSHLSTQLINRTYSMSVEQLFDCIFGDNEFISAYRASRRIKDYQANEWHVNSQTGKRERLCTYKVSVTGVIGSTTICSNERQVIDCELSRSHYIIHTEVRNEGIKYADSFFVATRYCLVQTGPNKSHLKITGEVRYIKSLMAIIKSFIEKNAVAALQDSFTDLMKRLEQESSKPSRTPSTNDEKEPVIQTKPILNRQISRSQQSNDLSTSSTNNLSINSQEKEEFTQVQNNTQLDVPVKKSSSRNSFLIPFCILTMLLLLIVNIFLCIKLNQIDHMTDHLMQNYPKWLNRYSHPTEDHQWSLLLKKQEEFYQKQINGLQTILTTTHNALKNVTDALDQLSQFSHRSR